VVASTSMGACSPGGSRAGSPRVRRGPSPWVPPGCLAGTPAPRGPTGAPLLAGGGPTYWMQGLRPPGPHRACGLRGQHPGPPKRPPVAALSRSPPLHSPGSVGPVCPPRHHRTRGRPPCLKSGSPAARGRTHTARGSVCPGRLARGAWGMDGQHHGQPVEETSPGIFLAVPPPSCGAPLWGRSRPGMLQPVETATTSHTEHTTIGAVRGRQAAGRIGPGCPGPLERGPGAAHVAGLRPPPCGMAPGRAQRHHKWQATPALSWARGFQILCRGLSGGAAWVAGRPGLGPNGSAAIPPFLRNSNCNFNDTIHVKCMTCFCGKDNGRIMQMCLYHMSASLHSIVNVLVSNTYILTIYHHMVPLRDPNDKPVSRYVFEIFVFVTKSVFFDFFGVS